MINESNYKYLFFAFVTGICTLYQIVYWWLFGLNAFEVLSINGLLFRSYNVIIYSFFFVFIGYYLLKPTLYNRLNKKLSFNRYNIFEKTIKLSISIFLFFIGVNNGFSFFILIPFISTSILILIIDIDLLFEGTFLTLADKNIILLVTILIISGISALAYTNAESILNNETYKYTIIPTNKDKISQSQSQSDTLKFIGKAEETFVFTSLKNDKIHFIKSENLVLYDK